MGSPTSTTDHQRQISNVQGWSAYPPRLSVVADIRTLPSSANNRHMQRSKPHSYSITSSAKM
jgi:hypothetical protein